MNDNFTNIKSKNITNMNINEYQSDFEFKIALVVGITFTFTFIVGLIGNTLVLLTVLLQKKMHNATNILILNLAIAELLFIIICVPFTGLNYVLRYLFYLYFQKKKLNFLIFLSSVWYFGDIVCRIVQYTSNVTAYLIVMLLVFMSIDRFCAVYSFSGIILPYSQRLSLGT
jgi:allatostatin receptor